MSCGVRCQHRFNPRAREGRDSTSFLFYCPESVSIHAPARGATFHVIPFLLSRICFNPRAREGRDVLTVFCRSISVCFNPRAREGRDLFAYQEPALIHRFNPRAREGRDDVQSKPTAFPPGFNPRAREGRDWERACMIRPPEMFQSTRPRGARRRLTFGVRNSDRGFNPRAREGRDR